MVVNKLVQIVGFGPACVGIFITAERLGVLAKLLAKGVYIYESKSGPNECDSLNYQIPSNSPIKDFLLGIQSDGIFADVMASATVQQWLANGDKTVCLTEISTFCKAQ